MKNRVFLILIVASFIEFGFAPAQVGHEYSQLKIVDYEVFTKGEKLEYLAHYGIINAGIASVEINPKTYLVNGKRCTKVTGLGKSTGAFDFFFKVRDSYVTYMNTETLEPYKFVRHVDEGGFVFDQEYNFDHEQKQVVTEKGDTVDIPIGVQDLVSGYYFARSIDLDSYKPGDVLSFKAFVDGVVEPVRIKYVGKETISIKSGKYRCFKFQPLVQKGRVFNEPEDLTMYISDDKNRVPVLIEAKVIVGSVKLELMTTRGLLYPLAKLD